MKYFLIVGEASGDLHGSNLIKAIKAQDKHAEFQFWGGNLMSSASGIAPNKHIDELAIMGFLEVIVKLASIKENFKTIKRELLQFKPDALVMVDYPGFNLRIAPFAKENNIPTFYYISPKVWAWKQKRVFKIKKYIDVLFTILPFETEFYKQFDYEVQYVGNPLLDAIADYNKLEKKEIKTHYDKPIIAILPGSRNQEISRILPLMIEAADSIEAYEFVIAGTSSFAPSYYERFFVKRKYEIRYNETYGVLSDAYAAMVTSGTATLETALFNVPQVVCYKANTVSYHIAKNLVKVKFMSLVNLILNREAVPELLQDELNKERLLEEIYAILENGTKRPQILADYKILHQKMGEAGASERVAKGIIDFLQFKNNSQ